ncbi:MAG: hypothetical protein DYG92_13500 [Leptolyngbya sp. PLA1]|nr:hypothetical protein [Leptolyngbya sp. PLA1]
MRRPPNSRHGSARSTGLLLAGGVSLIFGGVLVGIALTSSRPAVPKATGTMEPPPDVKLQPGGSGLAAGSTELFITLVDPANPTRVQYEITAERSEPLPDGRYRMTRPTASYFLRDGRTLVIEADHGQASIPDPEKASRPEGGVLEGNVRIRLFAAQAGGRRPALATDTPELSISTNLLRFDGLRGELELPERFDVEHTRFAFAGLGLTAVVNEKQQRIEMARVITPLSPLTVRAASGRASPPPPPAAGVATPGASPRGGANPVESRTPPGREVTPAEAPALWYHATLGSSVRVVRGTSRIDADVAHAWFLAEADAGPREFGAELEPGAGLQLASLGPALALGASTPQPVPPAFGGDEPVTIEWTGPLELRSAKEPPQGMGRNASMVRFEGVGGGVRASDTSRKASARGDSLEYRVDTREVVLSGTANLPAEVELTGSGKAVGVEMHADLAAATASIRGGPGSLTATGDTPRGVSWTNEADFSFATDERGEITHVTTAHLSGDAVARDGDASLRASAMHAEFSKGDGDSPVISRLTCIGQVSGDDGKGGTLSGDSVGVEFAPVLHEPRPTRVAIAGRARAARGADSLQATHIEADLGPVRDSWSATALRAREGVTYTGKDGLAAEADTLEADPVEQRVTLQGEKATLRNAEGSLTAGRITLDGKARTVTIPAPGSLSRELPATKTQERGRATASWSESLTFDDIAGIAIATGAAHAEMTRGTLEKDTLNAASVTLRITPAPIGDARATAPASPVGAAGPDPTAKPEPRQLLAATATGPAGTPASIESRRYAREVAPPTLEQLLYLEGGEVRADLTKGTLAVPGAGKAVSLDRRAAARGQSPGSPLHVGDGRGATLFRWAGSMVVERQSGTATLAGGVKMTHEALAGERTELESESLTARFSEQPSPGSDTPRGELLTASAAGGVWMRSGGTELRADSLEYDARGRSAEAWGGTGRPVTAVDPSRATPLTAARMRWDIATGRLEVLDAAPITAPRK